MQRTLASNLPISIVPIKSIRLSLKSKKILSSSPQLELRYLKIFWILTFLIVLSLFAVCIFQLNAYTKEIYLIKNYEKKINQLTQENKVLEINFSKANSFNNLDGYVQNQVFEKAKQIEYIRVLEGTALAR